jgi:hypothetical protein
MQLRPFFIATFLACASLFPCASASAMSQKPKVTVRFHTETNKQDGNTFAMPVKLKFQQRQTYLARVPEFSERNIQAIYPFRSSDGSWGCVFQLDPQGRLRLETMSSEAQGSALVVFIGTKNGQHQVVDMLIDKPVLDGIITVPRGITDLEALVLSQQFPVIGQEKNKKKKPAAPKKDDPTDWTIDRKRNHEQPPAAPGTSPAAAPRTAAPTAARKTPEPILPRAAD